MPSLGQYLQKTVLVSIPSIYSDGKARPYRLVAVEIQGLWLEDKELVERVLPKEAHAPEGVGLVAFVPYSQINCVIAPVALPEQPPHMRDLEDKKKPHHPPHKGTPNPEEPKHKLKKRRR
jgi:hypothetical protein